jgi:hypothetical protein
VKAIFHNSLTFLIIGEKMQVQMIELEEIEILNLNDDKLEEIVAESKTQYGSTSNEYVEGCQ